MFSVRVGVRQYYAGLAGLRPVIYLPQISEASGLRWQGLFSRVRSLLWPDGTKPMPAQGNALGTGNAIQPPSPNGAPLADLPPIAAAQWLPLSFTSMHCLPAEQLPVQLISYLLSL